MTTDTSETDRSSLRTLIALATTFAVGYVLGARRGGSERVNEREATEISIDESGTIDDEAEGEESKTNEE